MIPDAGLYDGYGQLVHCAQHNRQPEGENRLKGRSPPSATSVYCCGGKSPIASNEVEVGRAKNRRVELVQW
jgi:hypothetical protein